MADAITDKISKLISHFANVKSNSVAVKGSCQSMVYRSVMLLSLESFSIVSGKKFIKVNT